jgi:SAM-dependent methyltransferase
MESQRGLAALTIAADWEDLSELDPLWAILTEPGKQGKKWDLAEFFACGEKDMAALMEKANKLSLPIKRERCLDFGCGVGRLTRATRAYFEECHGVDVSSGMVSQARRLTPECIYHHNPHPDLRDFQTSSFDLVYSIIVLQHAGDEANILRYVEEFVRILAPQGLLVFQLPDSIPLRYRLAPKRRLYSVLREIGISSRWLYQRGLNPMRMGAVPETRVIERITRVGGTVLASEPDQWGGPLVGSRTYYSTK